MSNLKRKKNLSSEPEGINEERDVLDFINWWQQNQNSDYFNESNNKKYSYELGALEKICRSHFDHVLHPKDEISVKYLGNRSVALTLPH
ncbi:MAG: hypothetical protein IPG59_20110 [Candidatus Melainabacteria bacterium]|nr:MAG: hypothetical protein IPG59_20110 [Candidatus Melainabacteria bacterium]